MKYLKKFNTHAEYELATLDLPNVSYCVDNNEVHYNSSYIGMAKVSGTNKFIPVYRGLPIGEGNSICVFTQSTPFEDIITNNIPWQPATQIANLVSSSSFKYQDGTTITNIIPNSSVPQDALSRYTNEPIFITA